MTKNNIEYSNSAVRLLRFFEMHPQFGPGEGTVDSWKRIFKIENVDSPLDLHHEVGVRLNLATKEIKVIASRMRERGAPEELFAPYITRILHALSVSLLPAQWTNVSQHLSPDTLLALKWMGYVLGPDDEQVLEADIAEMNALLDELQSIINEKSLTHGASGNPV